LRHRRAGQDDPRRCGLAAGRRNLAGQSAAAATRISLRYALGKYFDDLGQYDEAFSNYRRANELTKRFGSSYDRAKLTQRVGRIIGAFDAAFVSQCQDGASASELPVFVIGMPRSGTSLTEQILASHPAVFGAGEVKFWTALSTLWRRTGPTAATVRAS